MNYSHVRSRFEGLDLVKLAAAFSVLLIHFCPFPPPIVGPIQILIRFAVPFFFMLSGFFLGIGAQRSSLKISLVKTAKKLSVLYLCWWAIYFIFPSSGEIRKFGFLGSYIDRFDRVTLNIEHFVFYGPTTHLWYFPATICAIVTIYLLNIKKPHPILTWSVALSVYVMGVLGGSYSSSRFGINLPSSHRHYVFFSMLPIYCGYQLSFFQEINFQKAVGFLLFVFGFFGSQFETDYLFDHFGTPRYGHDFLFSTLFMAFGAMLIGLKGFCCSYHNKFSKLGYLSGGIFLVHILVLQRIPYLEPLMPPLVWQWISPFIAFMMSGLLVYIIKKTSYFKELVP